MGISIYSTASVRYVNKIILFGGKLFNGLDPEDTLFQL